MDNETKPWVIEVTKNHIMAILCVVIGTLTMCFSITLWPLVNQTTQFKTVFQMLFFVFYPVMATLFILKGALHWFVEAEKNV